MELLLVFLGILLTLVLTLGTVAFFIIYKRIDSANKILLKLMDSSIVSLRELRETSKTQQLLLTEFKSLTVENRDNEIEKTEEEDIPLDENMRIPIVDGVNIQFEGDEQSYPVSIQ